MSITFKKILSPLATKREAMARRVRDYISNPFAPALNAGARQESGGVRRIQAGTKGAEVARQGASWLRTALREQRLGAADVAPTAATWTGKRQAQVTCTVSFPVARAGRVIRASRSVNLLYDDGEFNLAAGQSFESLRRTAQGLDEPTKREAAPKVPAEQEPMPGEPAPKALEKELQKYTEIEQQIAQIEESVNRAAEAKLAELEKVAGVSQSDLEAALLERRQKILEVLEPLKDQTAQLKDGTLLMLQTTRRPGVSRDNALKFIAGLNSKISKWLDLILARFTTYEKTSFPLLTDDPKVYKQQVKQRNEGETALEDFKSLREQADSRVRWQTKEPQPKTDPASGEIITETTGPLVRKFKKKAQLAGDGVDADALLEALNDVLHDLTTMVTLNENDIALVNTLVADAQTGAALPAPVTAAAKPVLPFGTADKGPTPVRRATAATKPAVPAVPADPRKVLAAKLIADGWAPTEVEAHLSRQPAAV